MQCKRLKVGDLVVPLASALGTWRDRGNFNEDHWHKVPSDLPLVDAATLTINPGTALSMLEHFVDLKEGDCVVQNGANSAVGQYVIQICKLKGVKTINVVRDRPDRKWDEVVADLKKKGADLVATPENVREEAKNSGLPKPKLALNCVGGEIATTMAKMLERDACSRSGTIVTYGGMGRQPVTIPVPLLIFNDIRCLGFWISGHMSQLMGLEGKAEMYDRLAKMVLEGQISAPPARLVPFADWKQAFQAAQGEGKSEKILLRMRDDEDNSEVNATPPGPEARRW